MRLRSPKEQGTLRNKDGKITLIHRETPAWS